MARINVLDKNTINRIAAGEVIDRPASIIKELVENSIDAGATSISIEIRGGGIELIRITDNGCGIDRDDIRVAFVRHATSKIRNAEDLSYITSLGFRGEALASVAAVADVELITKTKDAFTAVRYKVVGGEEQ
ncbi:MAG: DNA mismatch repair endonuclease MutL, partial [Lachnospiraceae bacterium]|nr:DNA mismatch repair endonuclease MutL [Lachnospiraceae bacterium]